MLSSTEFKDSFSSIKTDIHDYLTSNGINQQNVVDLTTNRSYKSSLYSTLDTIKLFFAEKFSDCKTIFNGLDDLAFSIFIEKCDYKMYNEKELIFEKGIDCNHYYFLVFGDIVLYSDARLDPEAKLLKTISGGLVFGHKVKDKLQYFAYAQSASVQLVKILKEDFDQIIEQMNDRKARNKMNFLKKYFPKFRTQPEEGISNLKEYFFRFEYVKGNKIIIDGEFDEYIYIILKGSCAAIKKIKKVPGLKEKLSENGVAEATHVILEKYERGDIIGAYSALKNHKSNLTVEVLSDKVEVYRIFKGDIFNLFGGIAGKVPEMLRSIDTTQQIHANIKLAFLEENVEINRFDLINKFTFIESTSLQPSKAKLVDESKLNNPLKDAYKVVESKVNSKINDLKASLVPNKSKGLSSLKSIENAGTLKASLKTEPSSLLPSKTTQIPTTNAPTISNLNGVRELTEKKPSINDSIQNKLNNAKASLSGLTSNQIASKNKLQSIIGKSSKQSQEEVDEAFKRINDRKKGDGIGSKLLSGLDNYAESVSFDALSKKLDKPEVISEKIIEKEVDAKNIPETKKSSEKELVKGVAELNIDLENKNSSNSAINNVGEVEDVAKKLESLILDNLVDSMSSKEEYQKIYTGNISARQSELGGSSIECDDEKLLRSFMKKKSSKLFPSSKK